ncbi:hypothetical protein, partial [Streptomyces acidiscabies]|uniref:hypothetical protein n=1 Tax=Streptomyces acidiscabies TaxID=42234 RepID=UPI001C4C0674
EAKVPQAMPVHRELRHPMTRGLRMIQVLGSSQSVTRRAIDDSGAAGVVADASEARGASEAG